MRNRNAESSGRWPIAHLGICLALVAMTWAVFGQTLGHDFVNVDDNDYVYANPEVARGLSAHGIVWSFAQAHADNWHPLTWISHMLDGQIYGLKPGGHHFSNLLLHAAAVLLLFLALEKMTGAIWRAAFVAAIFAVHPLHVESVAWIAERKDVLSALFFMLALGAYVRYARTRSLGNYITMSILFACGLMSKPMLVTFPFVLLLLDYWPLKRTVDLRSLGRLIVEKIPLFVLSAASCLTTLFAQHGTITPTEKLPLIDRLNNAAVSSVLYLRQMIWPTHLLPYYPHPGNRLPFWQALAAIALLLAMSAAVIMLRRRRPYLMVGWFWYLIMLIPVIGLVQVSTQGHADRYTYLPQIGLYIAMTWFAVELSILGKVPRGLVAAAAIVIIVALIPLAHRQASHWRNGESLWSYAIAVEPNNGFAQFALGDYYLGHGRADAAIFPLRNAVALWPWFPSAHFQLGAALFEKGELDEAIAQFRKVLALGSDTAELRNRMAAALSGKGDVDGAIAQDQAALQLQPNDTNSETELANLLLDRQRHEEAVAHYRHLLQLRPDLPLSHYNLAVGLHRAGRLSEAILEYKQVLALQSDYPDARKNLRDALLQNGQTDEAQTYIDK